MSWNSEDWKGVAATIGKIAPALGTILLGPVGGAAGTAISVLTSSLGVEETPEAVMSAIQSDPKAFAKIKQAELDNEAELNRLAFQTTQVEMKTNAAIIESLNAADSSGHSTRPKIALELARAFLVVYVVIGCAMAWAIYDETLILEEMWMTLLAYLGLPMTLLKMYFGDLRKEHAQSKGQQVDFGVFGRVFGGKK